MLELAHVREPLDAAVLNDLAVLQWQLDEKQTALASVEKAIQFLPGFDLAWDNLLRWSQTSGKPEVAERLARQLTTDRPGEARSWYYLAANASRLEERISASRKAIKMSPHFVAARDQLSVLLLENNQVNEALETCRHATPGIPRTSILRGREAWIQAQIGNLKEAIRLLTLTVADFPDYYWGWNQLREWHAHQGNRNLAIQAAEHLVWLTPRNSFAYGCLAESQINAGNTEEAVKQLLKAVHLDPTYAWAMNTLFGLQLKKKDWEAAGKTLQLAQDQRIPWLPIQLETRLLIAQKQKKAALALFAKLLPCPEEQTSLISKALEFFGIRKWNSAATRVLEEAINQKETNPAVGQLWYLRLRLFPFWKLLRKMKADSPCAHPAWQACLEKIGDHKRRIILRILLRLRGVWLAADTVTYGSVCYALANSRLYGEVIRWMQDWRERNDIQPWMLSNLVISLGHKNRDAETWEIVRAAISLNSRDHTIPLHQTWLAYHEALEGESESALRRLAESDYYEFTSPYQLRRMLTRAVIEMEELDQRQRRHYLKNFLIDAKKYRVVLHLPDAGTSRRAWWTVLTRMEALSGIKMWYRKNSVFWFCHSRAAMVFLVILFVCFLGWLENYHL